MTPRLLRADGPGLRAHLAAHGPLPTGPGADRLLAEVAASGLTGRGGGRFPVARKLAAVRGARRPVVLGNGMEGEPASAKDATVLQAAPHLVLDGLAVAAGLVGAARAVLHVPEGAVARVVAAALAERADPLPPELVVSPRGFLAGQESALVRRTDGGPALPGPGLRRVTEHGVGGRATGVHNVETLAHLALVARHGAQWFRCRGTTDEPGTMLCTLSGAVARPGVLEVDLGLPLEHLLDAVGGATGPLRALLVGGWAGTWVDARDVPQARLSHAGLVPSGASPGAGVVVAVSAAECPLEVTARLVGWLAARSARQCGPCLNGLPALATAVEVLAGRGWPPARRARVEQLVGLVDGRGACAHPDGTARLVRSTLLTFADELAAHAAGRCLASAERRSA